MTKSIIKSTRSLMVQGTASHVGKSMLTAAILKILKDRGFKAAPFKAQNMALNSSVTADGGEIGRAQAFQAEAAGIAPTVDMNPILLKPSADSVAQVIIQGKVFGNMSAQEFHGFKKQARSFVLDSYNRLASIYDVIVIEGAGSPAEINLRENDIANMGIAELTDSPVVIVGDIDRGGVFASLVGTMELLSEAERSRVRGFIINKFRGDLSLLKPGLDFLEGRTGTPVLGVVPYLKDVRLPDEDGVSLQGGGAALRRGALNIAVIKLPRISNFTDLDPFREEPSVSLSFVEEVSGLEGMDAVIIPGTKNTVADLNWLKDRGLFDAIKGFREKGGVVAGICGGFQMLGSTVKDPDLVEAGGKEAKGLCLLEAATVMRSLKDTFMVEATMKGIASNVSGYEIHMGETSTDEEPFSIIRSRNSSKVEIKDGAVSKDGKVWGTYIHGIFDNDAFRASFLNKLGGKTAGVTSFSDRRRDSMKEAAKIVEQSLDMERLLKIIGL